MPEEIHHKEELITKELLDHIEQLGIDGDLQELNKLNEKYLNFFYSGIEDSKSSLLDLSEYIDIVSEPLRDVKTLKEHNSANFFKDRILNDLSE